MKLVAIIGLVLASAGCGSADGIEASQTQDSEQIDFPVQDPTKHNMEALLEGTLVRQDRCLYVSSDIAEELALPIWPDGFSYEDADGNISVLDAKGKTVAEVGSPVSMGGGMFGETDAPLPPELRPRVESCNGPYWIVGNVSDSG